MPSPKTHFNFNSASYSNWGKCTQCCWYCHDTFNRASFTVDGSCGGWTVGNGTWTTTTHTPPAFGQVASTGAYSVATCATAPPASTSFSISSQMNNVGTAAAGRLIVNYVDKDNYWYGELAGAGTGGATNITDFKIGQRVAGVDTVLSFLVAPSTAGERWTQLSWDNTNQVLFFELDSDLDSGFLSTPHAGLLQTCAHYFGTGLSSQVVGIGTGAAGMGFTCFFLGKVKNDCSHDTFVDGDTSPTFFCLPIPKLKCGPNIGGSGTDDYNTSLTFTISGITSAGGVSCATCTSLNTTYTCNLWGCYCQPGVFITGYPTYAGCMWCYQFASPPCPNINYLFVMQFWSLNQWWWQFFFQDKPFGGSSVAVVIQGRNHTAHAPTGCISLTETDGTPLATIVGNGECNQSSVSWTISV